MTTKTKKVRAREIKPGTEVVGAGVVASVTPTPSGRVVRFTPGSPAVQAIYGGGDWVEVVR